MCLQAISCTNFETASACCRAIVEVLPKDKGSTTDLLVEFHVEDSLTLGESTSLWARMFCRPCSFVEPRGESRGPNYHQADLV